MAALTKHNSRSAAPFFRPFFGREVLSDRFLDDFFAPAGLNRSEDVSDRGWSPAVDVKENDKGVSLMVDLPGLKKEDINIHLEDSVLTVTGERKFERDEEKDNYHRVERAYGSFSRSFRLPNNVDGGSASASFTDGVLTLEIPKTEEAKPRSIEIH